MISALSYIVALTVALIGLLFTILTVVIAFIIAGLTALAVIALVYYIGKEIILSIYNLFR